MFSSSDDHEFLDFAKSDNSSSKWRHALEKIIDDERRNALEKMVDHEGRLISPFIPVAAFTR
jgi:hypothetical protein